MPAQHQTVPAIRPHYLATVEYIYTYGYETAREGTRAHTRSETVYDRDRDGGRPRAVRRRRKRGENGGAWGGAGEREAMRRRVGREHEMRAGERQLRLNMASAAQCGDQPYDATAVTFSFRPSVSALGFGPRVSRLLRPVASNSSTLAQATRHPHGDGSCTVALIAQIRITCSMFKLLFIANATRSRGTFGRNMVEYHMVRGPKPRAEMIE